MKIKALIVALVLGSSSAAMASPGVSFTAKAKASWSFGPAYVTPTVRDHRVAPRPTRAPAPRISNYRMVSDDRFDRDYDYGYSRWMPLTNAVRINNGGETFQLNARVSKLSLQNLIGRSDITEVTITYANGFVETVKIDQSLSRINSTITIDLNRRQGPVQNIRVFGSTTTEGSFQIHGA